MFVSIVLILTLVALDQYSKYIVELNYQEPLDLIPSFLELRYSQNTGIAFSFFEGHSQALALINTVIVLIFLFFFVRYHSHSLLQNLPAILIISGGLGNLIDRYTKSYVVDFINPLFVDFAIFNLADCFLNIGVALLVLEFVFNAERKN